MIHFQKKHLLILLISIGFLVVVSGGYYYFSINRMNERVVTLQQQLLSIQSSQTDNVESPEIMESDISHLVEKVPVESSEEQIIIDLEKAAIASDSVILNIGFNDSEVIVDPSTVENVPEENTTGETSPEVSEETEETIEVAPVILPEGLRQVAISMTVRSKDYTALTSFLENIRLLPRIYVVDALSFEGFEEGEVRPGPFEDEVEYSLQLSTYYAPIIEAVAEKSGIVLPPSADKDNPMAE